MRPEPRSFLQAVRREVQRGAPRHLASPPPDRSIGKLAGHTAARALGLGLVGLVVALPAGLGGAHPSIAANREGAGVRVPSTHVPVLNAAVYGSPGVVELPRPADAHRRPLAPTARKNPVAKPVARWVRPGVGILTSPFGMRWGKLHKGIDLGGPYGSPIYAATDGVVTFAGFKNGYERYVTIRHGYGLVTAYAHMSATLVRTGQHVGAGELIARQGSLGSGPHLHFEIWRHGLPVNPIPILRKHGVHI